MEVKWYWLYISRIDFYLALLFFYSRHSCHSTFFGCNGTIDHNLISLLILMGNIFSQLLTTVTLYVEMDFLRDPHPRVVFTLLRVCPTLALILLLYTVLTSKALRSHIRRFTSSLAPILLSCVESNDKGLPSHRSYGPVL